MGEAVRLLVWGAGGHGRVVAELAELSGHVVVGFVDRAPAPAARSAAHTPIAEDVLLEALERGGHLPLEADAVALGLGDNAARSRAASALGDRLSAPLVHPAATVSRDARLGQGSAVMAGAIVNPGARAERIVIVNSGAIVEHDCRLGEAAHVSPGAVLAGGVRLGARSWVGARAVVLPGIVVGREATVGAGAVVTADVGDGVTVVGVPARPTRGSELAQPPLPPALQAS